jgi:hypothetical protein
MDSTNSGSVITKLVVKTRYTQRYFLFPLYARRIAVHTMQFEIVKSNDNTLLFTKNVLTVSYDTGKM